MRSGTSIERDRQLSVRRNGLLELSWQHYWLLVSTLGGLLGLIGFLFVLHLSLV